jgi:hypothetical protein
MDFHGMLRIIFTLTARSNTFILIISGLFLDAVSSSDYLEWKVRMTN